MINESRKDDKSKELELEKEVSCGLCGKKIKYVESFGDKAFGRLCKKCSNAVTEKERKNTELKEIHPKISLGKALSIFEDIAEKYGLQAGRDYGEDMKSKSIYFKNLPLEDGKENELEDKLKIALPSLDVRHWQSGTSYFRNKDGKHINEISFEVSIPELNEGLGSVSKGFGQGLFDKGSTLASKPVKHTEPDEAKDKYVLIEVDGGDEYFIENIEPVRRLEPGEEILFTGPSVKYIKNRLAEMNRQDILDVVKLRIRSMQSESIYNKCKILMEDVTMKNSSKYFSY